MKDSIVEVPVKVNTEEAEALAIYYEDCQHNSWTYEEAVVLGVINQILEKAKEELVFNPS
ncbi:MAG: hypothetical protein VW270_23375 [Candidatus Poseidoniales archaeon]